MLGSITIPPAATQPGEPPQPPKKYSNILTLNTAGSNLILFSAPDTSSLISWAAALRLSAWEKSRLEEIYTAHLIRLTWSVEGRWREPPSLIFWDTRRKNQGLPNGKDLPRSGSPAKLIGGLSWVVVAAASASVSEMGETGSSGGATLPRRISVPLWKVRSKPCTQLICHIQLLHDFSDSCSSAGYNPSLFGGTGPKSYDHQ